MSGEPPDTTPAEHEAEIRNSYEQLCERGLAEMASSTLAVVIHETSQRPLPDSEADRLRLTASLFGAIRGFRAIRAGMAILGSGYELEADAMTRVVLELF